LRLGGLAACCDRNQEPGHEPTACSRLDPRRADHKARPEELYAAFMDPAALVAWLPPAEMTGQIHAFDARRRRISDVN
jgi:hypothetical protein